jgi:hypothetical protein
MTFAIVKVLAGAGDTEQHLIAFAVLDAAQQRVDRLGLIASRFKGRNELKV